jgi:uncharacterized ubiquitin-like protein YukD
VGKIQDYLTLKQVIHILRAASGTSVLQEMLYTIRLPSNFIFSAVTQLYVSKIQDYLTLKQVIHILRAASGTSVLQEMLCTIRLPSTSNFSAVT